MNSESTKPTHDGIFSMPRHAGISSCKHSSVNQVVTVVKNPSPECFVVTKDQFTDGDVLARCCHFCLPANAVTIGIPVLAKFGRTKNSSYMVVPNTPHGVSFLLRNTDIAGRYNKENDTYTIKAIPGSGFEYEEESIVSHNIPIQLKRFRKARPSKPVFSLLMAHSPHLLRPSDMAAFVNETITKSSAMTQQ
jgi:hypothetical protein